MRRARPAGDARSTVTLAASGLRRGRQDVSVAAPHLLAGRPRSVPVHAAGRRARPRAPSSTASRRGSASARWRFDPDRGFSLNGRARAAARRGHAPGLPRQGLGDRRPRHGRVAGARQGDRGQHASPRALPARAAHAAAGRRDGAGRLGRGAIRQRRPIVVLRRAGDDRVLGQPRAAATRADSPAVQPPVRRHVVDRQREHDDAGTLRRRGQRHAGAATPPARWRRPRTLAA